MRTRHAPAQFGSLEIRRRAASIQLGRRKGLVRRVLGSAVLSAARSFLLLLRLLHPRFRAGLGSAVGGGSPLPLGQRSANLRTLLDASLFPACFPVRSSEWLPLLPPVAPGGSALSARPVPVARLERRPMDFLGALGRDCAAEVLWAVTAPRPLPPARPAASVPVALPASADEIRRRFENQRRDLVPRGGGSLPLGEPVRAGSVARSGAQAVAHRERSPRHRSLAAHNGKRKSRRDDRHADVRSQRSLRSPRSPRSPGCVASRSRSRDRRARIATVLPLPAPLVRIRLLAMRLDIDPRLHVLPLRRSANDFTLLVARSVPLTASKVDGVEKALHRSHAGSSSQSAPPATPDAPFAVLLPHNLVGSPARSASPLPAGTGFVGAGGGDLWAQFASPRPLPAPRDLAVLARRSRVSAFPPQMKPVPTATLAHLWSLAGCL
ncbi:unnamed protein product [Closterium sp. NIES-54]